MTRLILKVTSDEKIIMGGKNLTLKAVFRYFAVFFKKVI